MEAHYCRNGYIRKYPAILCSNCRAHEGFDIEMNEKDIDEHNEKRTEEINKIYLEHLKEINNEEN
jgi:hypothetical protein